MEDQFSNQEKPWEAQIVKLVHAFAKRTRSWRKANFWKTKRAFYVGRRALGANSD
jgi:hypothetical protein